MNTTGTMLEILGLGAMLVGGLMIVGIFQPFSGTSSSTCVGILLFGQCFGYWQNNTVVNGNNLIVGISAVLGGIIVFFIGATRHGS